MKWWIKFGCFLTGYNYNIIAASSEVSVKALKRYTSAMMIVCVMWSFIGFVFTKRYLSGELWGSVIGALILCFIIIQIERQIILSTSTNKSMYNFRILIAIVMALIGSIIIDQIIFQKDIELGKLETLNAKVDKILPSKEKEIKTQIVQLQESLLAHENERKKLTDDITLHPVIKSVSSQSNIQPVVTTSQDSTKATRQSINVVKTNTVSVNSIPNPNIALIAPIDKQISDLRTDKATKEASLIKLRTDLEKEIKDKTGFLDELIVMVNLIKSSWVALIVWLLWLTFLIGIELFVMFSKKNDEQNINDYDLTIRHHMALQKRKLALMYQAIETSSIH
ncbi:hypothetical protein GCM10027037_28690 [Mucilaginibacter koreensis]